MMMNNKEKNYTEKTTSAELIGGRSIRLHSNLEGDTRQQIKFLTNLLSVSMDALAATLYRNQEVVLHSLTPPKCPVIKIINGHLSGRKVGDSLFSTQHEGIDLNDLLNRKKSEDRVVVLKNYKTITSSGKKLQSASVIYYSQQYYPLMALSINVDDNFNEELQVCLKKLIEMSSMGGISIENKGTNIVTEASIREIINKYSPAGYKIHRRQRVSIIEELLKKDVFKIRGAVSLVANILGVTRYTIYNDIERIAKK